MVDLLLISELHPSTTSHHNAVVTSTDLQAPNLNSVLPINNNHTTSHGHKRTRPGCVPRYRRLQGARGRPEGSP